MSQERSSALRKAAMKRFATIASGLKARHLAALIAVALAPSGLHGRQATPFVAAPDAQDPNPTATLTPSAGSFIRVSTLEGTTGVLAGAVDVAETLPGDLGSVNYLNKLGTFNFANDYPIVSVNLGMSIDSVILNSNGDPVVLGDRLSFLMHQFSLLFVGITPGGASSSFLISQNATLVGSLAPADDNFQLTLSGTTPALEYVATPSVTPPAGQITSLEWIGPIANDPAWDPDADADPSNDTFPTTADLDPVPPGLTDISFNLQGPGAPGSALYGGGAGQTSWEVYFYTTGPSLGGALQLNLSQIIIAVEVPESSHALWGGLALLGTAEVLRRRRHAS